MRGGRGAQQRTLRPRRGPDGAAGVRSSRASAADPDRTLGCGWIDDTSPLVDLDLTGRNQPAGSGSRRFHQVPPVVVVGAVVERHELCCLRRADRCANGLPSSAARGRAVAHRLPVAFPLLAPFDGTTTDDADLGYSVHRFSKWPVRAGRPSRVRRLSPCGVCGLGGWARDRPGCAQRSPTVTEDQEVVADELRRKPAPELVRAYSHCRTLRPTDGIAQSPPAIGPFNEGYRYVDWLLTVPPRSASRA